MRIFFAILKILFFKESFYSNNHLKKIYIGLCNIFGCFNHTRVKLFRVKINAMIYRSTYEVTLQFLFSFFAYFLIQRFQNLSTPKCSIYILNAWAILAKKKTKRKTQ